MPNKDKVLLLHSQGLSVGQIAEKLKVDPGAVRDIVIQQWADEKDEDLMRRRVASRRGR